MVAVGTGGLGPAPTGLDESEYLCVKMPMLHLQPSTSSRSLSGFITFIGQHETRAGPTNPRPEAVNKVAAVSRSNLHHCSSVVGGAERIGWNDWWDKRVGGEGGIGATF